MPLVFTPQNPAKKPAENDLLKSHQKKVVIPAETEKSVLIISIPHLGNDLEAR